MSVAFAEGGDRAGAASGRTDVTTTRSQIPPTSASRDAAALSGASSASPAQLHAGLSAGTGRSDVGLNTAWLRAGRHAAAASSFSDTTARTIVSGSSGIGLDSAARVPVPAADSQRESAMGTSATTEARSSVDGGVDLLPLLKATPRLSQDSSYTSDSDSYLSDDDDDDDDLEPTEIYGLNSNGGHSFAGAAVLPGNAAAARSLYAVQPGRPWVSVAAQLAALLSAPSPQLLPPGGHDDVAPTGRTVLLLEPCRVYRSYITQALWARGHGVLVLKSGAQLRALMQGRFAPDRTGGTGADIPTAVVRDLVIFFYIVDTAAVRACIDHADEDGGLPSGRSDARNPLGADGAASDPHAGAEQSGGHVAEFVRRCAMMHQQRQSMALGIARSTDLPKHAPLRAEPTIVLTGLGAAERLANSNVVVVEKPATLARLNAAFDTAEKRATAELATAEHVCALLSGFDPPGDTEWHIGRQLGRGASADVFVATETARSGLRMAVKVMRLSKLSDGGDAGDVASLQQRPSLDDTCALSDTEGDAAVFKEPPNSPPGVVMSGSGMALPRIARTAVPRRIDRSRLQELRDEVDALTQLRHPGIIRLYRCERGDADNALNHPDHQQASNPSSARISAFADSALIFVELCTGGTLSDLVRRAGDGGLPRGVVQRAMQDILSAVDYMHSQGYVHCDLKSTNVLRQMPEDWAEAPLPTAEQSSTGGATTVMPVAPLPHRAGGATNRLPAARPRLSAATLAQSAVGNDAECDMALHTPESSAPAAATTRPAPPHAGDDATPSQYTGSSTQRLESLYRTNAPPPWVFKLADFGSTQRITPECPRLELARGTVGYMAPEVLLSGETALRLSPHGSNLGEALAARAAAAAAAGVTQRGYDYKADIWSVGCLLLEMLTGRPPFSHLGGEMVILDAISNLTHNSAPDLTPLQYADADAGDMVRACLRVDPQQRPTAQELLRHPFMLTTLGAASDATVILPLAHSHVLTQSNVMGFSILNGSVATTAVMQSVVLGAHGASATVAPPSLSTTTALAMAGAGPRLNSTMSGEVCDGVLGRRSHLRFQQRLRRFQAFPASPPQDALDPQAAGEPPRAGPSHVASLMSLTTPVLDATQAATQAVGEIIGRATLTPALPPPLVPATPPQVPPLAPVVATSATKANARRAPTVHMVSGEAAATAGPSGSVPEGQLQQPPGRAVGRRTSAVAHQFGHPMPRDEGPWHVDLASVAGGFRSSGATLGSMVLPMRGPSAGAAGLASVMMPQSPLRSFNHPASQSMHTPREQSAFSLFRAAAHGQSGAFFERSPAQLPNNSSASVLGSVAGSQRPLPRSDSRALLENLQRALPPRGSGFSVTSSDRASRAPSLATASIILPPGLPTAPRTVPPMASNIQSPPSSQSQLHSHEPPLVGVFDTSLSNSPVRRPL
jgi:serine/threonine protein kinase